ncbi:MAG: DUF1415 domain-containing protein [Variovorax sp.]
MTDAALSFVAIVEAAAARANTVRWLERAVIGLNLCPFAKAPHVKRQIHCAVFPEVDDAGLMDALLAEAADLMALAPSQRETTLLLVPNTLCDFLMFNDFTRRAERQLARAGHDGVLQLASFHPGFEFAGSAPGDITNVTNRSPHPTLHLLREASISRAVAAFPDADAIGVRNMATLEALGAAGWAALQVGAGEGLE